MVDDNLSRLWALLDPSRFPKVTDKVLNIFIVGLAAVISVGMSLATGSSPTSRFPDLYRNLMPRDMLIRYRGCLFNARRSNPEIIWLSKAYEPYSFQVFRPESGDIVVDVGSHVGKYTLPSAKSVGEDGHVFAFEPVPKHYRTLVENIDLNGLSNVTTINAAAYDRNQEMWLAGWDLQPEPDPEQPEVDHVNPDGNLPVDALTVDGVLEENGVSAVDYVKIDIGRQEFNAIKGMENTLRASDEVTLLVEVEKENFADVDGFLTDLGFEGTPLEEEWGRTNQKDYLYEKTPR